MNKVSRTFAAMVTSLPLLGCAVGQQQDRDVVTRTMPAESLYSLQPPQRMVEEFVDNFTIIPREDKEYLVNAAEIDLDETDHNVIAAYFRKEMAFSPAEAREIREAMQAIAATPEGYDLLKKVHDKVNSPIFIGNVKDTGSGANVFEDSRGEYQQLIALGELDRNTSYFCNDNPVGNENKFSLIRVLYHELYHIGVQFTPEYMSKPGVKNLSQAEENEAVKATDAFMAKNFGECPRVAYSNAFMRAP